mgnify:CR=1 FL=1
MKEYQFPAYINSEVNTQACKDAIHVNNIQKVTVLEIDIEITITEFYAKGVIKPVSNCCQKLHNKIRRNTKAADVTSAANSTSYCQTCPSNAC